MLYTPTAGGKTSTVPYIISGALFSNCVICAGVSGGVRPSLKNLCSEDSSPSGAHPQNATATMAITKRRIFSFFHLMTFQWDCFVSTIRFIKILIKNTCNVFPRARLSATFQCHHDNFYSYKEIGEKMNGMFTAKRQNVHKDLLK